MRVVKASEAQNNFSRLVDMVQREPVTITSYNRPVAVMISLEDYEQDQKRKLIKFSETLDTSLIAMENDKGISTDELLAKLGLDKEGQQKNG